MTSNFNLIDERWIPCIRTDGSREELSLHETLVQAHTLQEIQGDTPLETAAILRLLLAVLHRNFGPADRSAWRKLWQKREVGFDMQVLDAYFAQWRHKFNLFDERYPFFQSFDDRVGIKSIISMILHSASGNNGTLFDHSTESSNRSLSLPRSTRVLLVSQAFGIGGLSGLSQEKFTDAPCAKGIIFLAQGDTIFETLVLNLVKYGGEDPIPNEDDDCPAWELEGAIRMNRESPRGYLDYLTWHNRRIWLFPEQQGDELVVKNMRWSPGLRLKASDVDPHKQYTPDEEDGWRILCFRADRALWRDSSTLLRVSSSDRPPKVVKWLSDLAQHGDLEMNRQYKLMALGMAKDRASVEFFRIETLPLLPVFLTNSEIVEALAISLSYTEEAATQLHYATLTLARLILKPATTNDELKQPMSKDERERAQALVQAWNTDRAYWSQLEPHFHRLVMELSNNAANAQQTWRDQLRRAANGAFDYAESCAGSNLRAQRACAKAREAFDYALNRVLKVDDPNQLSAEEPANE